MNMQDPETLADADLLAELEAVMRKCFEPFAEAHKCKITRDEQTLQDGQPIYSNVITQMAWMAYRAGYLQMAEDMRAAITVQKSLEYSQALH